MRCSKGDFPKLRRYPANQFKEVPPRSPRSTPKGCVELYYNISEITSQSPILRGFASMQCGRCRCLHRILDNGMKWWTPSTRASRTPARDHTTLTSTPTWEGRSKTFSGLMPSRFKWFRHQQQGESLPMWTSTTREQPFWSSNDDTRAVEVEDLGELQYPRQRFDRPVRYAVFAYGHRRDLPEQAETSPSTATPTMVPNLPTDIDFPGLSPQLSQEFRAATARLHLNLGHPSRQELCRLLAYEGNLPDAVFECAKKLRCATCERLRPKQPPRPSGMPSLVVGQFGDELQMDVFYCRTLRGETFIALGMVDRATGFQQAIIIPDRSGDSVFQCMEQAWLKPYGLPIHVSCDPDTSFRGSFQERLEALSVHIEHCAAESHWQIGMVERRNALLRTMLEKLIDQFGAVSIDECSTLLAASVHAINSGIHTHGRSAYQAVFGRQPRLANSNFNDPMVLSSSVQVANLDSNNSAAYKAEFVRCEALKTLHELDCSQHLRRALLRKTRATKVADLQPGQPCAYWRWTRRGSKKRGSWKIGRFLSWDPSHVGKQAWLRTGGSTTLVTAEQLRSAFGFEQWSPSEEDVRALKDASTRFDALLDDRGPAPEDLPVEDDDIQGGWDEEDPT